MMGGTGRGETAQTRPRRWPLWAAVFLVFLGVYTVTWGGHYTSGDGATKIAWAKAMLSRQSADIDPGPAVAYSKYGVGHSLLAMVPLAASAVMERVTGVRAEAALYTWLFVANGALLLALIAWYLSAWYPRTTVWTIVGLVGLCTTWWPFTKLDYSEPLVLTGIFAAFLLVRQGRLMSGMLVAGLTSTIRQDSVVLVAVLGAWHLWKTRRAADLAPMALAVTPGVVLHLLANMARYGSVLAFGYEQEAFETPLLVGLYGLLFSAGKSVFLFSPPLIAGLLGWRRFAAHADRRADAVFFAAVFVVQTLFYARFWAWSSDDSWGVRFLIPGVVLLTLPAVELWHSGRRAVVAALAAVGFAIQLLPVSMGALDYVLMLRANAGQKALYYGFKGTAPIGPDDLWYHPSHNQIVGTWTLLRVKLNVPPTPRPAGQQARIGSTAYEAFPPEVWRRWARWDFIWVSSVGPEREKAR